MSVKRQISEERIARKQRELTRWVEAPRCNPWQYSQSKASYPSDPQHIDYRDPERFLRTRLHDAVRADDLPRVKTLIEQGANPWVRDGTGRRPLYLALNYIGSPEMVTYLRDQMKSIQQACKHYERETGKKLGLRSQRRPWSRK